MVGITGTGGAGKSSVTDELLNRFLASFPEMRMAVISVDPTRRRTGGALLGDRIRMNSLRSKRVFMRSMATRRQHAATNVVLQDCIAFLKSLGYDLVIVETAGIGQSDSEIVDLVDFPMYVMTSDFGAPSQLGLNGDAPGLIPTKAWYEARTRYKVGYATNAATGQGDVNVSVIQVAMAYAALANDGTLLVPQVVDHVESSSGERIVSFEPKVMRKIKTPYDALDTWRRGMKLVV